MRAVVMTLSVVLPFSLAFLIGCSQPADTTSVETSPAAAPEAAPDTYNEYCPIMGGKVTAEGGTAEWDGKLIGFCCDGCEPKWEELSDEEKAVKLAEAAEKGGAGMPMDHDHMDHEHENNAS